MSLWQIGSWQISSYVICSLPPTNLYYKLSTSLQQNIVIQPYMRGIPVWSTKVNPSSILIYLHGGYRVMNNSRIPGFSAEVSLYTDHHKYNFLTPHSKADKIALLPQVFRHTPFPNSIITCWGSICAWTPCLDSCIRSTCRPDSELTCIPDCLNRCRIRLLPTWFSRYSTFACRRAWQVWTLYVYPVLAATIFFHSHSRLMPQALTSSTHQ